MCKYYYGHLSGKEVLNGKGVKPFTESKQGNTIGERTKGSLENNRWDEEKKEWQASLSDGRKRQRYLRDVLRKRTNGIGVSTGSQPFRINPYYDEKGCVVWLIRHLRCA